MTPASVRIRGPNAAWLLLPVVWLVASALASLPGGRVVDAEGVHSIGWTELIGDQLVAYGWWAVLFPIIVAVVLRLERLRMHVALRTLLHVLVGAGFVAIYFLLRSRVQVPGTTFALHKGWAGVRSILPQATTLYTLLVTGTLAVAAHKRSRVREREAAAAAVKSAQLQAQLTDARLHLLRAQLHPHFLFNALHAISALIDEDPAAARTMLIRLSELLRLALRAMESGEITLAQEIEWLEQYIELQQLRYDERLAVNIHVSSDTLAALLPPLVLQPLVENAIKYAVDTRDVGGTIQISSSRDGGQLVLSVLDDGGGPDVTRTGTGIGLRNTRERLAALYGGGSSVELRRGPNGGAEAVVRIPFREAAP